MSLVLQECGYNVQDILHLLAASIVKDANGVKYIRMNLNIHDCSLIDPAIDCSNSHVSPQELLKEVIFTDDCGENLIINISIPSIPA